MKLHRFIFILICLSCLIQARGKKRFKRFLGGSKSTTTSTTTTNLPTLNTKTTKFSGNNNFSKLMTQLQSESFNNKGKDEGKLYLALQPYNKPPESSNLNGMSSSGVLPIYYSLPTTKTSSEMAKHENTWPLFQFQGNEGGGVSLKMFYDRNGDGQNQLSTINNVTTFSNNVDQNIEDDMLISHNLDPSVKYTSMTAPNAEEKLPPINYVGYVTNPQETFTKNPYYTSPSDLAIIENKDYSITETRNVQNEMYLSKDKSENLQYLTSNPVFNAPQTNLNGFENKIGFIGHNNFREEPKSFLGYQNDLSSEGSFDTALNRHSENNLEEKNLNGNGESRVQDGSRFNMDQYGRYLRSPNHKKSKHKR